MESVQKMLKAACEDSGEVEFRNDYSGRGMYGRKCVGITGSRNECARLVGEVIKQMTQELFEHAIDCEDGQENAAYDLNDQVQQGIDKLLDQSMDSMGLDVIVYFERLEPLTDDELSEDDKLPTDDEFDEMSEHALLQWVAAHNEYHTPDDDVENWAAVLHTAKVMRDRIREDRA